jgi:2-dehydro-3-deoxyphosphooctonate aldolase (KDO 8-P synthase)
MIPETRKIEIGKGSFGGKQRFALLAGPCIAESKELLHQICETMMEICERQNLVYVFKTSFDKANRSSINSYRGPGEEKALEWVLELKEKYSVPVVMDVHEPAQCERIAKVADILQIPAFLCRQTDLVTAAAATGKIVNVKKGQFLSPWDVGNIATKCEEMGNKNVAITERGFSFGYNNLIVDPRTFPVIRSLGYPVIFDATHSVQLPGGLGSSTGGQREFIPNLARAAVANGIDGLFMEVHPEPKKGLSDPTTMYPLHQVEELLKTLISLDDVVKNG